LSVLGLMTPRTKNLLLAAAVLLTAACSSDGAESSHDDKAAKATGSTALIPAQVADSSAAPHRTPPASLHTVSPHAAADPHAMRTPHPPTHGEEVAAAHGDVNISVSTKSRTTLVPDSVIGQWQGATFILVDRDRSNAEEVQVGLESEFAFGDGHLKIFLHSFLPDLKINEDNVYTSVSNRTENPAAHVTVYEDGKEVFDGWLFSEFPGIHPFSHPRFGVTLKAGIPS